MKNATKLLVATALVTVSGTLTPPSAHAGPMGPSARMAARLKKYPTSAWLAHYLPDDRYKIAGGVWKFVSTDLDTYYHRPDSPLMLSQPASRVIGFSSVQEAEEAGYRPDPNLDAFGGMDMGAAPLGGLMAATPSRRVVLADGTSTLSLPKGWKKSPGKAQRSQYVNSTTERFFGPKGERFEVSTLTMNAPATAGGQFANADMGQFINVRFFNQMKANLKNMAGNLNRLSQSSGAVNSQFSGQNMVSALGQLDKYRVSAVNLGGIEGVATTITSPIAGQPNRSYSVGRGRKVWSISDFSPRSGSLAPILKTVRFR